LPNIYSTNLSKTTQNSFRKIKEGVIMCDGVLIGMMLGAVAGAILVQTCKPVRDAVEKGKQKLKDQVAKM